MKHFYKFQHVLFLCLLSYTSVVAQHFTPENTGSNPLKTSYMHDVLLTNNGNKVWLCTSQGLTMYDTPSSTYTNYTVADGIVPGRITVCYKDANSNIWFGGYAGISKFNGTTFTNYTTANSGLIYDRINSIFQDSNGDMWFGTASDWQGNQGGISKLSGSTWTSFTSATTGLPHNEIHSITQEGSNMWFGTKAGLAKFNGTTWTSYTTTDGLIDDKINVVVVDNSNNLWIGTNLGVSKYDGTTFTNYTTTDGLADNKVYDIFVDGIDIYFATKSGISKFDGTIWTTPSFPSTLASNVVTSIYDDNSGISIIGTTAGAATYNGTNWVTFSTDDNGMINSSAFSLIIDNNGDMWSSGFEGVSRFDGVNWTAYNKSDGLNNNYYWSMLKDATGNIWMQNTTGNDVVKYDISTNTFTTIPLPAKYEECSYLASNGDLWFGAFEPGGGAIKFDGVNWTVYNDPLIPSGQVYSIADDASGNMYFATNDGVVVYNGSTYSTFGVLPAGEYITEIFRDASDNLWFTGYNKYYKYDGVSLTTFGPTDGISSGICHDIVEDAYGRIFFGTNKSVDMYDGSTWTTFGVSDGLPDGNIYSLGVGLNGKLWIGYSGKGVYGYSLPVSNKNITKQVAISMAPNPTAGFFQITSPSEIIDIEIATIQGQIVWNQSFQHAKTIDIDLTNQPKGLYIVTAKTPDGVQAIKLAKE